MVPVTAARRIAVLVIKTGLAASARVTRRGILGESRVGALRRLLALLRVDAAPQIAVY